MPTACNKAEALDNAGQSAAQRHVLALSCKMEERDVGYETGVFRGVASGDDGLLFPGWRVYGKD